MSGDRMPPRADEAEAYTLGAMLQWPECIAEVFGAVSPADFHGGDRQEIARAIRAAMTSASSVPRAVSRRFSSSIDGGRTNTRTTSPPACWYSCCAPCQSMSNSTSRPADRIAFTGARGVP